jgi:large subunit ribosomal protein L35
LAASVITYQPFNKEKEMPKMKTVSGAKKRFKVTAKGRVKFKQAKARHMQMNKPKKMKRKARGTDVMIPGDERLVLRNYMMNDRVRRKRRDSRKVAAEAAAAKGAK